MDIDKPFPNNFVKRRKKIRGPHYVMSKFTVYNNHNNMAEDQTLISSEQGTQKQALTIYLPGL